MILESAVIGFVVMILGLLSLTIVTGRPLGQSFRDTQMMGVFFMTGVLLAVVSYILLLMTVCSKCNSKECSCGKTENMFWDDITAAAKRAQTQVPPSAADLRA